MKVTFKKAIKKNCKAIPYLVIVAFGVLCFKWFEFSNAQNHKLLEPVVNGVVGGIVTSVLIFVFSILWRSNITPWIENLLYKDTKIEGIWNGVLVPYIGIDEIDKRRLKFAVGIVERRRRNRKDRSDKPASSSTEVSASSTDENGTSQIDAELILKNSEATSSSGRVDEVLERKVVIKSLSKGAPIEVRLEIKRIGHQITGTLVEIGGASQIHTYEVSGSFKNLILTGVYENDDRSHIDRGSLSLMLKNNGSKLEGFFSSYADQEHCTMPFKCVLNRQIK
ncbi:conserved hypothetical protein [Vibrio chagasii]|nr:conserved hypothetical protein [Vibrio chagasii]CAH6956278.1 conserved hypothetical protein [Vibrio chagasii]CAH7434907.1 conserved hypothetical protein [Vibrio chagasii]